MGNDGGQLIHTETVLLPKSIQSHGVLYEDRYKKIERITAEFEGFSKEYFVSDSGEKAAVLVVRDRRILLVRQYRLLINGLSYEIPAGKVEDDERPEETAVRECFEETGVACRNLRQMIAYDVDLDCIRNRTYVFFSHEADVDDPKPTRNHVWMPSDDCLEMVHKGEISDSLSIIAILAYHSRESKSG